MGTKTTDTQTNQYNQAGMAGYNQMMPAFSNAATGYINNPFGNPFFQQQQQMGRSQAAQLGGTAMSNLAQNQATSGIGGGGGSAPWQQEQMQNQQRANTGLTAQLGFMNPTNNALQLQQGSMGMAQGFKPLQTGATDVKQTSGLGTWLPQLLGGALGAINPLGGLMKGVGGLASAAGSGMMGMMNSGLAGAGAPQMPQSSMSPFFGSFNQGSRGISPQSGWGGYGGGPQMPMGPQVSNSPFGY